MKAFWIALNAVKGLGPVKIELLIRKYGTVRAAFEQCPEELLLPTFASGSVHNKTMLLEYADK